MTPSAAKQPPCIAGLHPALIAAAAVFALATIALGAKFCLEHGLTYTCPSILILGLPCPGCGGTRALASLAQLDLWQALRFNPLLVIALGAALVLPFRRSNWDHWSKRAWWFFGAFFVLNWVYLLLFLPR